MSDGISCWSNRLFDFLLCSLMLEWIMKLLFFSAVILRHCGGIGGGGGGGERDLMKCSM